MCGYSTPAKLGGLGICEAQAISRCKRIIGGQFRARSLPAQKAEVTISIRVLNRMAELGMPITERIT